MSTIKRYMPDFRTWARAEPHRCRVFEDGPSVRTKKLGPSWHDVIGFGPLLFALIDAIEERGGDWDITREGGTYSAGVVIGTIHVSTDDHDSFSRALLTAYAESLRMASKEEDV